MRRSIVFAASLALVGLPAVAAAQTESTPPLAPEPQAIPPAEASVFDGDYLTIGGGGIYGPSYEGSDDQVLYPVPLVQGRLGGIGITPRPGGVALDLIPDGEDPQIAFTLGPVITYSRNRHNRIEDPVVRAAGRLKSALDIGVTGGVTAYKLLSDYDSVTVSADVRWNVNNAHEGMTVMPSVTYFTPLSRGAAVSLNVNAKHVDHDYADYYFSVSPLQSAGSALPQFAARGGWASVGAGLLGAIDLDGNLLNGGLSLIGLASYSRLLNDAKDTPYTAIRGDADQWLVGAGVAYTF